MRRSSSSYVEINSPKVIEEKLRNDLLIMGIDVSNIFFWVRKTQKGKIYVEAYMGKTKIASANASKTDGEIKCSYKLKFHN